MHNEVSKHVWNLFMTFCHLKTKWVLSVDAFLIQNQTGVLKFNKFNEEKRQSRTS